MALKILMTRFILSQMHDMTTECGDVISPVGYFRTSCIDLISESPHLVVFYLEMNQDYYLQAGMGWLTLSISLSRMFVY